MRYALVLVAVAGVIAGGTATAAAPDPFAGAWFATDVPDGSDVRLQISMDANGVRRVVLTDNRTGEFCGGGPARAIATGIVSGSVLTASGTAICPNVTFPLTLTLVASGGTLFDGFIVFHREGS